MAETVIKISKYSYVETIARLSKAIVTAGNTIFAVLDQSKAATNAGLSLRPTSLILFGNPRGGTPLMEAFPLLALELPLKLLIWEEAGQVNVAYTEMSITAQRYSVAGKDAQLAAMDKALDELTASLT